MCVKQKLWARWLALAVCLVGACLLLLPGVARAEAAKSGAQVYTIINTVKLENRSARPIYNINLEVPLASVDGVDWQEVLGEEFSPAPTEITVDADGRRVGHYTVSELKSGETLNLVQRVAVRNYCIAYDVSNMGAAEAPAHLAAYVQATADINCDSAVIRKFAADNTDSTANPYLKARLLFAAVNSYMTYDNTERDSHSAVAAYYRKAGNCEDYANLYAALLRAEGIPARVVNGYLYSREAQTDSSYVSASGHINADKLRHSWVMFYINDVGWLVADPTFSYLADDEGGSVVDWSRFARITGDNRLVYTGDFLPDNNRISYDYQGAAPLISYNSELALYSLISPFGDIVNHWAAESVLGLYYQQPPLVSGISANNFGVNKSLTRAELAAMLNRVLDRVAPVDAKQLWPVIYTDVAQNHWAYAEIVKATARGFISGYADQTFKPDALVTRAEAAVMLSRVLGSIDASSGMPYTDMANYGWAQAAVCKLYQNGIMRGVSEQSFAPARNMTRGEGAAIVYRWLKSPLYRNMYVDY